MFMNIYTLLFIGLFMCCLTLYGTIEGLNLDSKKLSVISLI